MMFNFICSHFGILPKSVTYYECWSLLLFIIFDGLLIFLTWRNIRIASDSVRAARDAVSAARNSVEISKVSLTVAKDSVDITRKIKVDQDKKDLREFLFALNDAMTKAAFIRVWVLQIKMLLNQHGTEYVPVASIARKISDPPAKLNMIHFVSSVALKDVEQINSMCSLYDIFINTITELKNNPIEPARTGVELQASNLEKMITDATITMRRVYDQCLELE